MNFVEVIYKHLMGVLGHHKKKDIIGLRDTDSPTFAGLTVTGVADLSVEIKNMIVVDESVQNIAGVSYKTWALADAWITANVTPSRTNVWGIEIHGTNAEDVIVRAWVTIQGMASTILTGNVTFGGVDYTYYNAYTIKDCTLNNFTGGGLGTAAGVLRRCEIRGGVSATVFCILADCWVVEWTSTSTLFTAYFFCSIFGVGAGVIMDPTTMMINGYITNATIQGGMFTGVDIDNNTWALSEDLEIRNCFLNDNLDMSTSSEAVIVSFLNSTIDNETITIGAGNTLFTGGDITGLTITEDGGTWLKGDGYFTDAFIYDDLSVVDDFDVDGETTLSNLSVSGNSIFNLSAYDKDFTINKETSDTAFKYDAGLDTIVISSNVGIGIASNASLLLLGAGTATSAPLQFTSGTLLDTPLPGTLEYDGCSLYMTNIATQRALDRTSDVAIATVTVANTTNETVLWTAVMPANSLCTGNVFKFHCDGIIENDGAAATEEVTLRIKVNGNTIATLNPTTRSLAAGSHWHIDANATQRTLGASGSRAVHIDLNIDDVLEEITAVATINTTLAMDVTVTAEWASADVNNTISLYQGFMEYKN